MEDTSLDEINIHDGKSLEPPLFVTALSNSSVPLVSQPANDKIKAVLIPSKRRFIELPPRIY
jgi:hypothetical protein